MSALNEVDPNSLDDIYNADPEEMPRHKFEHLVNAIREFSKNLSTKPKRTRKNKLSSEEIEEL